MDLSNLKPAKGTNKSRKRIGRGEGSGHGDTATRGHKGAKSRSGYRRKFGYEGGQMPLYRRIPKYGFKNPNRVEYTGVNLDSLQNLAEKKGVTEISPDVLYENGLAGRKDLIKILGRGELKTKLDITAHAFSAAAIKSIEENGGKINKVQ